VAENRFDLYLFSFERKAGLELERMIYLTSTLVISCSQTHQISVAAFFATSDVNGSNQSQFGGRTNSSNAVRQVNQFEPLVDWFELIP